LSDLISSPNLNNIKRNASILIDNVLTNVNDKHKSLFVDKNRYYKNQSSSKSDNDNSSNLSKNYIISETNNNSKFYDENSFIDKNKKNNEENKEKYIILIVDDHKFTRDSLKNMIQKIITKLNMDDLFKVEEANDGSDIINNIVLDQQKNNRIKCIITDENMEYINGSQAIKIIRDLEKDNRIKPVTIVSNSSIEENTFKKLIHEDGVDYFLPKPCNENQLTKFFESNKIFEIENHIISS